MKILVATDGVFPLTMGGSHRLIFESCRKLSDLNHQVTCVVPSANKNSHFKLDNPSLKSDLDFDVHQFATSPRFKALKALQLFSGYKKFIDLHLPVAGFDVVNVHYFPALVSLRNLVQDRRFFYTFHGPWAAEARLSFRGRVDGNFFSIASLIYYCLVWPGTAVAALLEGYLLRKCRKIMVISDYAKQYLINVYKVPECRITVNYCGVDCNKFYYDPSDVFKTYKDGSRKVFITIRRLEKRMGLDLLIKAACDLKRVNPDFVIIIFGKGIHEDYLKRLIEKYDLSENVKLGGFLREDMIRTVMSSADLFILPSLDLEGFGLVVLESMACGTPVLVSPVGGAREVVSQFNDDYVLSGLSPTVIASYLSRIMKDDIAFSFEREDLVKFVVEKFSWDRFSKGVVDFFGVGGE